MSSTGETRSYVLAASPRTGSSWLCGLLSSLGTAGFPVEYAREIDEKVWRDIYRLPCHMTYFWSLPARSSTPNGVFALKLLASQLVSLAGDIRRYTGSQARTDHQAISDWMGRPTYFWMRRRDQVRQAVSFARAMQTDRWASSQRGNGNAPVYRHEDIERAREHVALQDERWATYFQASPQPPIELWYEELVADPGAVLSEITRVLGLTPPTDWHSPMHSQSDSVNEEWVRVFSAASSSNLRPSRSVRSLSTGVDLSSRGPTPC